MTTQNKMTKTKAIEILKKHNISLGNQITYASKNKGVDNYWANPNFKVLDSDWTLILNNWLNNSLIVFNIPKGSIKDNELIPRSDKGKNHLIDIQMPISDISYTDSRSKFSFSKYLVDIISYREDSIEGECEQMLDWNGNGKIDPVDIGVSVATESEEIKEKKSNSNKANAGCLTTIIIALCVIVAIISCAF